MKFLICISEEGGMGASLESEINMVVLYGPYHKASQSTKKIVDAAIEWSREAKLGDFTEYGMGLIVAVNDNQELSE